MAPVRRSHARVPPSVEVAVTSCCAAVVVGLGAMAAPGALALALWLGGVVLAWGWAGMLALPAPRGTSVVLLGGGALLVLSAALDSSRPGLTWVPAALAVSLIGAFLHQLLRVDGRPRIVESVSSVTLGLGLIAGSVLFIPLAHSDQGAVLVGATIAGAAASALTDTLGRWAPLRPWLVPLALLSGGAAAVLVAVLVGEPWRVFLLAGVVAGAASHALRRVLCILPTMAHARPRLVMALTAILATGPVAYAVALALLPATGLS